MYKKWWTLPRSACSLASMPEIKPLQLTCAMTPETLIEIRLLAKANLRPVGSEALIAIQKHVASNRRKITKAARNTTVPARRHFEK